MGDRFGCFWDGLWGKDLETEEEKFLECVTSHCSVPFQSRSSQCGLPRYAVGCGISLCAAPQLQVPRLMSHRTVPISCAPPPPTEALCLPEDFCACFFCWEAFLLVISHCVVLHLTYLLSGRMVLSCVRGPGFKHTDALCLPSQCIRL